MKAPKLAEAGLCDDYAIALSKFRFALDERHVSQYTVNAYIEGARRFVQFLEHDMGLTVELDKVTREHAREWLSSLRKAGNMPATVHARHQAARQLFKAAIADGDASSNPFDGLQLPQVEMKEVVILTPEEIQAMVAAAGRDRSKIWGVRDQAIIVSLYDAGLRSGELVKIRGDDIDWEAGAILIHGKGRMERWVGLGATALRALNRYLNARKRYEVGKKWWQKEGGETTIWLSRRGGLLTTYGVSKALTRRAREAGIKKHVHPHMFRHSAATSLASDMPESELRAHFGWSPTSPQVFRYTRTNLAQRAIARHRRAAPGDRIRL